MKLFNELDFLDELQKHGLDKEKSEAIVRSTIKLINKSIEQNKINTFTEILRLKIEIQSFIVKALLVTISLLTGLHTLYEYIK